MEPTHIAFGVALFITGLFLGERITRRKPNSGKIDFLVDNTLSIKENQKFIMATLAELNAKIDELQTTVDAEQEQIAAAIAGLNQTIEELRAQLADQDPAAIQAAIDRLDGIKADLESTVPDSEEPTEPGQEG